MTGKTEKTERRRGPRGKAAMMEARLYDVLYEIEKAQAVIRDTSADNHAEAVEKISTHLSKAIVIGNGGDLMAWYQDRVGV